MKNEHFIGHTIRILDYDGNGDEFDGDDRVDFDDDDNDDDDDDDDDADGDNDEADDNVDNNEYIINFILEEVTNIIMDNYTTIFTKTSQHSRSQYGIWVSFGDPCPHKSSITTELFL